MPNWVYNNVYINGPKEDIVKVKNQLNSPFSRHFKDLWNNTTFEMESKDVNYSNPIFAFWNIVKPTNLEAYVEQRDHSKDVFDDSGNDWYSWNNFNWGTKWDVAVADNEEYAQTELTYEGETSLAYRFDTAWGYPEAAIMNLAEQYPSLTFDLEFEEESGWGGHIEYQMGACGLERNVREEYDSKCRECDNPNTLEYCEDCCNEVCSICYFGAEEECETHKELIANV